MEISLFIKGFLVGVIISAPIGPVGAYCIQRTISEGRTSGIVSGLGAATGDMLFALIAAFGLTFISGLLVDNESMFRVVGAIFLFYFGTRVYLSKPPSEEVICNNNHASTFGSAFLLTLSNPLVILSIVAVYAVLGIVEPAVTITSAAILLVGVFVGCLFLWIIVCDLLSRYRGKLGKRGLSLVKNVTGIFIMGCGVY